MCPIRSGSRAGRSRPASAFPIGEVTVIATHLGLSIHERYAQARALADLIDKPRRIVLGDFNDWFWVKSVRRVLASRCPVRTRLRTFPSRLPVLRLDRIYATPRREDREGMDRPGGEGVFGSSAGGGGYRL